MPFLAPVDLMAAVDAPGEDGVPVMELLAARLGHRPNGAHLSFTASHRDLVGSKGIFLEGTTDRIGVLEALHLAGTTGPAVRSVLQAARRRIEVGSPAMTPDKITIIRQLARASSLPHRQPLAEPFPVHGDRAFVGH